MKTGRRQLAGLLAAALMSTVACGSIASTNGTPPGSVAILVLDDFTFEPQDAAGPGKAPPPEESKSNCAYTIDGQPLLASLQAHVYGGQGAPGTALPEPHGIVVYNQLSELLNRSRPALVPVAAEPRSSTFGQAAQWVREFSAWQVGRNSRGPRLILVQVDTMSYNTQTIRDRIDDVTSELKDNGYSRVVLNLSFVFAPCDFKGRLRVSLESYLETVDQSANLKHLHDTLTALTGDPDIDTKLLYSPALAPVRLRLYYGEVLSNAVPDDPLRAWIGKPSEGLKVIPIAAAGNADLDFAYAPGLWPEVVSVSASVPGNRQQKASYSNNGEVMLDGRIKLDGRSYSGTSFAAPRLSYLAALYLLANGPTSCAATGGSRESSPPLAYDSSGTWRNHPLATAIALYCPTFDRLVRSQRNDYEVIIE